MRVSLFITCLVDVFDPDVGMATVEVLRAAGCQVSVPGGQVCCGQPAWNSGFASEAARVAATSLAALEADGADAVVVPAGSCATMIRVFWPEMFELAGDHDAAARARSLGERTRELCELLAARELPPLALDPPVTVAYHHSCHMLRELRITEAPIALLQRIEGCQVTAWDAGERCCGFGGLFSTKLPETSVTMADHKLASLAEADPPAEMVVGADCSCLMHLRTRAEHEGRPIVTRHAPAELGTEPEQLAAFARSQLRAEYLAADLGITGCNFAVAETGSVVLVENEGNGRLSTSLPRVHVALMGLERLVADWAQLDLMLNLLGRSGTGDSCRPISCW